MWARVFFFLCFFFCCCVNLYWATFRRTVREQKMNFAWTMNRWENVCETLRANENETVNLRRPLFTYNANKLAKIKDLSYLFWLNCDWSKIALNSRIKYFVSYDARCAFYVCLLVFGGTWIETAIGIACVRVSLGHLEWFVYIFFFSTWYTLCIKSGVFPNGTDRCW